MKINNHGAWPRLLNQKTTTLAQGFSLVPPIPVGSADKRNVFNIPFKHLHFWKNATKFVETNFQNQMSAKYKIRDQHGLNFLTCTVCGWVDLFSRAEYRDIILESWKYSSEHKGLQIWGYVLAQQHQIWQHDNHPIELYSEKVTVQKLRYIHANPLRSKIVRKPEDWVYSSASNYAVSEGVYDVNLLWTSFEEDGWFFGDVDFPTLD